MYVIYDTYKDSTKTYTSFFLETLLSIEKSIHKNSNI